MLGQFPWMPHHKVTLTAVSDGNWIRRTYLSRLIAETTMTTMTTMTTTTKELHLN